MNARARLAVLCPVDSCRRKIGEIDEGALAQGVPIGEGVFVWCVKCKRSFEVPDCHFGQTTLPAPPRTPGNRSQRIYPRERRVNLLTSPIT